MSGMRRLGGLLPRRLLQRGVTTRHGVTAPRRCSTLPDTEAAPEAADTHPKAGEEVHGFRVTEQRAVPELQLHATRLRHLRTGADLLHVRRPDPNNAFSINFRTTPRDSSGVPHILEHTVLCGSRRYPVRDPFFKMLNRSLATFMNAMTGSDFTMYPFATQNPTDFRNLMSVYLDAVFRPNLASLDFKQEGWRLEHSDPTDPTTPIEFKGVVFNEMKGMYANSNYLFSVQLQQGLLPSHTYGVSSGGLPIDIPKLSWEQLKKFHEHHYHPSNARIFTYGDQDLRDHLAFINDNYLSHFTKIDPDTKVPDEARWSEPRSEKIHCSVDPMANPAAADTVAVSYMLSSINDIFESFVLSVLGELLTSGPNAPFYKSLLEPQLGASFAPSTGYSGDTKNTYFSVGLQGTKPEDYEKVLETIESTFQEVAKEGFPKERVKAILHGIELSLKHQTPSFGIGLAMNLAPYWNQDVNPVDYLEVNSAVDQLKKCLKEDPEFLQKKVTQYFIENKHKYTLTMSPKAGFEEDIKKQESELLANKIAELTEADKAKILEDGKTLADKQSATEDLSCLPTLRVKDISREVRRTALSEIQLADGVKVQICPVETNGVAYFNTVLNAQDVPDSLLPLIPLLSTVLTKMGAAELNFKEFDQQAELKTGGLGSSVHLTQDINSFRVEKGLMLSSYCLQKNFQNMLDLWEKVIVGVNMKDTERFKTLIKMLASDMTNQVIQSGHKYAMQASAATTGPYGAMREAWGGLTYVKQIKSIADAEAEIEENLQKLSELAAHILSKEYMRVALNVSPEHVDTSVEQLETFLKNVGGTPLPYDFYPEEESKFTPKCLKTHHVFPCPVNYASVSVGGVPYCHEDAGPLRVMGRLMFPYLHREIREKGGAYGGGVSVSPGGPVSFYSYRDPNSLQTFNAFQGALDWVMSGKFSERDVEEAKLGVFQGVDSPTGPGSRGLRQFLSHVTDDDFEKHRQSIIDTSSDDIVRAARTHLKDCSIEGRCLIGPANDAVKEDCTWTLENH